MQGKTVVITGATSGIGEVAADRAGRAGRAHRLHRARPGPRRRHAWRNCARPIARPSTPAHLADLSRLAEMKRVAGEIAAAEPQDRRADQQCRRAVQHAPGDARTGWR